MTTVKLYFLGHRVVVVVIWSAFYSNDQSSNSTRPVVKLIDALRRIIN